MTNTQNTETSSNADIDTLESIQSMSQNSAVFHAILNGSGSSENPWIISRLSQLSGGTTQLKSGLYSGDKSMKALSDNITDTDQWRKWTDKRH